MSQYSGHLLELTNKSLHLSVLWCTVTKCEWMKRLELEKEGEGGGEEGREREGGNGRQEEGYAAHTHHPHTLHISKYTQAHTPVQTPPQGVPLLL